MYDENMTAIFSTLSSFVGIGSNGDDYILLNDISNLANTDHKKMASKQAIYISQIPNLGNVDNLTLQEGKILDT